MKKSPTCSAPCAESRLITQTPVVPATQSPSITPAARVVQGSRARIQAEIR